MCRTQLKLPGKHKNNTTKSNRKERDRPKAISESEPKSIYLKKLEEYMRLCSIGYDKSYINYKGLQNICNMEEVAAKKLLRKLAHEGHIQGISRNKTMPKGQDYYNYRIIHQLEGPVIGNIMKQKFDGSEIRIANMKQARNSKPFMHNNFLKNDYNHEAKLISAYDSYAERWENFDTPKRASLMLRHILTSKIICCHFIDVCKKLTPKERQRIISKICNDPDTALYTLLNADLSKVERKKLVASAVNEHTNWSVLLDNLTDKSERVIIVEEAFKNSKGLADVVTRLRDYLDDDDKLYLAMRVGEINNLRLANEINNYVTFNDEQKDFFAHLVLAYRMSQGGF